MALLLQHKEKLITSVEGKIIVVDREKGSFKSLTIGDDVQSTPVQQEQHVISMDISKSGDLFCLTTSKKDLLVYKDFNLFKTFLLNRVASKVRFTPDNDIIVADKSGDVYLCKVHVKDHKPELLLGHLSMLLDVVVSPCNKYIITCDRDEKIRVSCYPNAYNIVTFCLGHREFVTNIELHDDVLMSASGDGTIKLWNYLKGEIIDSVDTNEFVDVNLKEKFTEEMDKENVEISALPIKNMQAALIESKFIIAISLLNYNGLLIFEILNKKLKYLESIKFDKKIVSYSLDGMLIVLTSQSYECFKFIDSHFISASNDFLNESFEEFKINIEPDNNSLTVLYKRKYDNVQEYLERKKQRLEGV